MVKMYLYLPCFINAHEFMITHYKKLKTLDPKVTHALINRKFR